MRIQLITLILITNLAFGQRKVTIDKNVVKYEIEDEFNRFDDLDNSEKGFKRLSLNFKNSELEIKNSQSSGFTGDNILFVINNKLELKNVSYDYWTDVIDENITTYKVKSSELILNQNPFNKKNDLRGSYILEIEYYWNDTLTKTLKFKGKFKSYEGIDKNSPDYKWALEKNKIFNGITNHNGIYLKPDRMPYLKSYNKALVEKIKLIKGYKPGKLQARVVINESGKIEKEPFSFYGDYGHLNSETQNEMKKLLIEFTDWYPACVNEIEVKSQIPIVILVD